MQSRLIGRTSSTLPNLNTTFVHVEHTKKQYRKQGHADLNTTFVHVEPYEISGKADYSKNLNTTFVHVEQRRRSCKNSSYLI